MNEKTPVEKTLEIGFGANDALGYLWMWSFIAFVFFFPLFVHHYLPTGGIYDVVGLPVGHDFTSIWTGAKLLLAGKASYLTAPEPFRVEMGNYLHFTPINYSFSYPPNSYVFFIAFGLLGYLAAVVLWMVLGIAAFGAALRASKWNQWRPAHYALFFLSPAAVATICACNNGFFSGCLFLLGLLLCETQPILAGVFIGLLTIKPHLGVIFIPVLLLRRNMRCFASAAVTALLMAGVSVAIWGIQPWLDYVNVTMPDQMLWLTRYHGKYAAMMPSIYTNALMSEHTAPTAATKMFWAVLHGGFALWAAAVALRAVYKTGINPRSILMLSITAIMIPPYSWGYDMTAITGAIMIYIGAQKRVTPACFILAGLLWMVPLILIPLKFNMLPIASFFLPAMLWYVWRSPAKGVELPSAVTAA